MLPRLAPCHTNYRSLDFRDGGLGEGDGGYLGVVGGSGYPADDEADHYSVVGYLKYARSCSDAAEKSDSPTQ